jgi:hypothetical protein
VFTYPERGEAEFPRSGITPARSAQPTRRARRCPACGDVAHAGLSGVDAEHLLFCDLAL